MMKFTARLWFVSALRIAKALTSRSSSAVVIIFVILSVYHRNTQQLCSLCVRFSRRSFISAPLRCRSDWPLRWFSRSIARSTSVVVAKASSTALSSAWNVMSSIPTILDIWHHARCTRVDLCRVKLCCLSVASTAGRVSLSSVALPERIRL